VTIPPALRRSARCRQGLGDVGARGQGKHDWLEDREWHDLLCCGSEDAPICGELLDEERPPAPELCTEAW
jgi:hypothetical protein